jgi:hypothetical protein
MWLDLAALMLSVIAIIISIRSWVKSRAVYGVEREVIRQYDGSKNDLTKNEDRFNEKLSSGKYTILATYERLDRNIEVLLGRLKKEK